MKKTILALIAMIGISTTATAQNDVLEAARKTNDYFMAK